MLLWQGDNWATPRDLRLPAHCNKDTANRKLGSQNELMLLLLQPRCLAFMSTATECGNCHFVGKKRANLPENWLSSTRTITTTRTRTRTGTRTSSTNCTAHGSHTRCAFGCHILWWWWHAASKLVAVISIRMQMLTNFARSCQLIFVCKVFQCSCDFYHTQWAHLPHATRPLVVINCCSWP